MDHHSFLEIQVVEIQVVEIQVVEIQVVEIQVVETSDFLCLFSLSLFSSSYLAAVYAPALFSARAATFLLLYFGTRREQTLLLLLLFCSVADLDCLLSTTFPTYQLLRFREKNKKFGRCWTTLQYLQHARTSLHSSMLLVPEPARGDLQRVCMMALNGRQDGSSLWQTADGPYHAGSPIERWTEVQKVCV